MKLSSEQIHNMYCKICYAGVDSEHASLRDKRLCEAFKNKEWNDEQTEDFKED